MLSILGFTKMTSFRHWKKWLFIAFAAIVFVIMLQRVISYVVWMNSPFKEDYERFWQIQTGMSESEVLKLLGQPDKILYKESAPENYYVKGWNFKKRTITNKVYIYIAGEPIAYIYFDGASNVEDTFVGGS